MIKHAELLKYLGQNTAQYYICAEILARNEQFYFTNCDKPIEYRGKIFTTGLNIDKITIENIKHLPLNQLEIFNSEEVIKKLVKMPDLSINLLIFAEIESGGVLSTIFSGIARNIKHENANKISIIFDNNIRKFENEIGDFFSPTCRAEFGDSKCKKDLENYTFSGKITRIFSENSFEVDISKPDGHFLDGFAKITNQNNDSVKSKIISHKGGIITILSNFSYFFPEIGNNIQLISPCGKTLTACKAFDNVVNFRGEPFIKSGQNSE